MSPTPKFGGHKHYGSGDIMFPICHLVLRDQVAPVPFEFISQSKSFIVSHHLATYGSHRLFGTWNMVLNCHVISWSRDHMIKGPCALGVLKVSHYPTMFGGYRNCSSWDIMVLVCHVSLQGGARLLLVVRLISFSSIDTSLVAWHLCHRSPLQNTVTK